VPRLLEGGLGAQVFGIVTLPGLEVDLAAAAHRQIDLLERAEAESEGRLRIARTPAELRAPPVPGVVRATLGLEGAHALQGELEELDRLAARGLRYLGLLHFSRNEAGAPALGPGQDREQGLTAFGRALVERCQELGLVVDLAHINRRGFHDAVALHRERPPLVSHTGLAGVHDLWRNIDDEQLRAVADRGGAVGVIFCPAYLGRDGLDGVVAHLLHLWRVAGEDTPALGSDWDGFIRPTRGLEEPQKLPHLTDALLSAGMPEAVVRKVLRDNALRVLSG
jgi:membrane dipeptidase